MKTKQEQLKELLTAARDIAAKAEQEERDFSGEERTQVTGLLQQAKALKAEIKAADADAQMREQIGALEAEFGQAERGAPQPGKAATHGRGLTVGEQFVQSPAFREWMKQVAPSGQISESARGLVSPPVELKSLGLFRKDLITGLSDLSAGAFVQTDYTGFYEALGRIPLTLRQLVSIRQTTSDLVEFVRQTIQVQEAAPVAEANVKIFIGATGEIEGEKPQGRVYFEKVTATVKTIAVWIAATKRALSDAAQIRGIIDQELREDLAEELENQMINGNGVGENFNGLTSTAGTLVQAFNANILTTCRQAITTLEVTGRTRPTGWLFHPTDWETVDLLTDTTGQFYWGGPVRAGGPPSLWGYPVATSQLVTAGTGWLGNWRKAVLWDREAYSLQVSDSHSDFFIRNLVAFLAEMRAAFGLIRPSAFINVELS